MAVFRVEKTKNYTVMSNHHLRNKNLSLKAKGLLSLMLSLPDNWDYSTEGLAHICKEGIDAICKAVNELESQGYITRNRIRDEKGRLSGTEYVIHEQPLDTENNQTTSNEPKPDNPVLDNPILEKPVQDNPILEKPILGKPGLENPAQLNTNQSKKEKINTDVLSINPSITNQSIALNNAVDYQNTGKTSKPDRIGLINLMESYRAVIHENIEYDSLIQNYSSERVNEYVQIMLDAICSRSETVRVDCADYPVEVVKSRLLKLDYSHVEYVLDCMAKNTTKVYNIKNYLLTALYNSYTSIDSYYQAEVNHDLYGK